ncbi:exo-alpha-sialidase [candidate division KSB1 bacterium]|nr:exo-alpha-sialidase [candidate division KSB1 bacterium]
MTPKLIHGELVIISQAPAHVRNWGPWQFPIIQRLPDNRLQVKFHLGRDSAKDYGTQPGSSFSADNGKIWSRMAPVATSSQARIFQLPNGDQLQQIQLTSLPVENIKHLLPQTAGESKNTYTDDIITFYETESLPEELHGWQFSRLKAGSREWQNETAQVNIPGEVCWSIENVFARSYFRRIRQAPDGSLWGVHYARRIVNGKLRPHLAAAFLRSPDNGHTFEWISEIPYQPIPTADALWQQRQGFTEPDLAFLPDGSLYCLMRTTDGHGTGPSYCARSVDGGRTWSQPAIFDDLGVLPTLLTLKCGVTLAAYGRPGLYLRATAAPDASAWNRRITLVEPDPRQHMTCAYSDMIELDNNSALIVYSDFNVPDQQGNPCKTILVRKITVAA